MKGLLLSLAVALGFGTYIPQDDTHITKILGNETSTYYVEDPGSH